MGEIRIQITRTEVRPLCPHCRERPVLRAGKGRPRVTCGHPFCQFRQAILRMRKKRKTNRINLPARIEV